MSEKEKREEKERKSKAPTSSFPCVLSLILYEDACNTYIVRKTRPEKRMREREKGSKREKKRGLMNKNRTVEREKG